MVRVAWVALACASTAVNVRQRSRGRRRVNMTPGLVETGSTLHVNTGAGIAEPVELCEICQYVLNNKMQLQPFLCRGMEEPAEQRGCTVVMESMFWYLPNVAYWAYYGCQHNVGTTPKWVRALLPPRILLPARKIFF